MNSHQIRFDADLIRRYDRAGPRYTSYPTAVQFTDKFGLNEYRAAAMASNQDPIPRPLSLYVHIPFCSSPCFYCGCTKVITRNHEKAEAYLYRLHREIELQSQLYDRDREVEQLHFGGGTPTFLTSLEIDRLIEQARRATSSCRATRTASTRSSSTRAPSRATRCATSRTSASTAAASASRTSTRWCSRR